MTIGLIIFEMITTVMNIELEPIKKSGVLTYNNLSQSTNPTMVIIVTLILGVVGYILMKKYHFPWLIFGTLLMISGSLLSIWFKFPALMNTFEFLFIISLMMTKQFQDQER